MHRAERLKAGATLERHLELELAEMQTRYPNGFVVRLHILGDFYSTAYVDFWKSMLNRHAALHVFGYTARWSEDDPIARAVMALSQEQWSRFAVRFSNAPFPERSTVSVEHPYQIPPDTILCPAQTGRTASCTTCGLCWQTTRRIAFLQH